MALLYPALKGGDWRRRRGQQENKGDTRGEKGFYLNGKEVGILTEKFSHFLNAQKRIRLTFFRDPPNDMRPIFTTFYRNTI